jgi:hypothetical protein
MPSGKKHEKGYLITVREYQEESKRWIMKTYTVGTKGGKGTSFRKAAHQGIVGRWRSTSTIWRPTCMINEQSFNVRIWPWILAQLVLPIETITQWCKHEISPSFPRILQLIKVAPPVFNKAKFCYLYTLKSQLLLAI